MKPRKSGLVLLGQIVGIIMGGPEMIKRYLKKKSACWSMPWFASLHLRTQSTLSEDDILEAFMAAQPDYNDTEASDSSLPTLKSGGHHGIRHLGRGNFLRLRISCLINETNIYIYVCE
jgi:hypothetical protein